MITVKEKLIDKGYKIERIGMILIQGEADHDNGNQQWDVDFKTLLDSLARDCGVELAVILMTAQGKEEYRIQAAQEKAARDNPNVVLGSNLSLAFTIENGCSNSDGIHWSQKGHNLAGLQAGETAGIFITTGEKRELPDPSI